MVRGRLVPEPGTLWERVKERTDHALDCGALQPISTECEIVEQAGIGFLVRVLSSLAPKEEARKKQHQETFTCGEGSNPFLSYDRDLFVADISDTHVCLLNKFNVIDHHLLVVTRSFEEQESWLNLRDFEAVWACMDEFEGLAFYNAGRTAGASQRHKHLQLVPLPLASRGPEVPIEPVLASARFSGPVATTAGFPFVHAFARLDPGRTKSPLEAAEAALLGHLELVTGALGPVGPQVAARPDLDVGVGGLGGREAIAGGALAPPPAPDQADLDRV